jgi:DNA-binding MarR family transcriptional regulator
LYDHALASAGLTVTQYAVLVHIACAGEISRTALAALIGMDRTTLTRNLGPLERSNLVVTAQSHDRRERLLCLSPEGRRKLAESQGIWQGVQSRFLQNIGPDVYEKLRKTLEIAEKAAQSMLLNPES